ncbi:E3 ubiquitin-protein ligase RNF8-B-like [Cocos nucifera]|uniref:E3 ubiquitin-protein ligase RMA n=1 Tax=Cocos nucifera TaxID=13894 RepID=A0A8K0IJ28_COCNU|nr:E3 ubiquitin-protein ligase RNF8-B-like [Cocos nucifera]
MADDENSMDLNLYVGLPLFPRPRNPDLGSDLTLSSPTFQRIYSPSNALHTPESLPVDPLHAADDSPAMELNLPARLVEQEAHASDAPNSAPYAPSSAGLDQPSASHPPAGRIPQLHDEAAASINPCPTLRMIELMSRSDSSNSRHGLLECPELRFQRLIESNNRLRPRSSRLSDGESSDWHTSPAQLMHDIMQSQRNLEASKKDNLQGQGKSTGGLKKEKVEESAAEFECNICLDMAKEPVVTPCGHLFCWRCLYQWLHANPVFPECPVCKGKVQETNLTPIYGRGGSDTTSKKESVEDGNLELKIPPRPHAHRTESLRQELQRSTGRSLVGERATAWSRIEELRNAISFEEDLGPSLQFQFNGSDVVHRLSQWSVQREETSGSNITGVLLPTITEPPQINSSNSLANDGFDRYASSGRLRAELTQRFPVRSPLPRLNSHGREPLHRRPTVQSTLATEQASPPSTAAVITGDGTATDISAEPNGERSSRSLRRRGRSSNSGSLDAVEGASPSHRRRRLN